MRYTLISLIVFISSLSLFAETEKLFFDQISLRQGLCHLSVKVIYRDEIGMLWIGTKMGLNRYDGTQIKVYHPDKQNNTSIPNDDIFFVAEDSAHTMWVGTQGTLCRYDRQNDAFFPEKINGKDISLRNILVSGDYMYSASATTLYIYNCKNKKWIEIQFQGDETNILQNCKLETGFDGNIIIASPGKGLFFCNPLTGNLKRSRFFNGKQVVDILHDSKNRLWISEMNKGVFCYDKTGKLLYDLSKNVSNYRTDQVTDMIEYKNKILMTTDGNGIVEFNPDKNESISIFRDHDNPLSLPVNGYLCIYRDRYNCVWLGSVHGGLIGVKKVKIQSFQSSLFGNAHGLTEQTVLCFCEDKAGMIWIGTDGEGINSYNPTNSIFTHFSTTAGKKVASLTNYSDNELLVCFHKEGIKIFNKKNGTLTPFPIENIQNNNFNNGIATSVYKTTEGQLYIANNKVYSYSIQTKKITEINEKESGEGTVRIYSTPTLPHHLILYSDNYIRIYNTLTDKIEIIAKINTSVMGVINAVEIDNSGLLWLGMSSGLYTLNPKSNKLTHLKANMLNSVSTLIFDKKQSLWIGSGLKLYRYSVRSQELVHYSNSDGVTPNEFLPKSRLCTQSGDIFMGGIAGFCQIDAGIPFKETHVPTYELLDIQLNGSLLPSKKISKSDDVPYIHIPWNYSSLSVNMFLNTDELGDVNRSRYIIGKLNSEVYYNLDKQSINLPTLSPGFYNLIIQTELKNEQWSEPFILLKIRVRPPWWQAWWFYVIFGGILVAIYLKIRNITINKTKRSMEKELQDREKSLSEQKIRFLINISHELRTPLTLIYAPLRRLMSDEGTPEALMPKLTLMYKHVKNMKNMIDMVLDVRKMELKNEDLNKKAHALNNWIINVADDFMYEFRSKQLTLRTDLDGGIGMISFDKDRCDKILTNLLMNAIKFSDEYSNVTICSKKLENKIRISVIDEGMGVRPEDVPNLFTRFYQTKHDKGGSGIGLSYAKTQVELHGGTIGYEPNKPTGSIFWFELPIDENLVLSENTFEQVALEKNEQEFIDETLIAEDFSFDKLTALIVDDEPDMLAYMKESLGKIFKKIICANNGEEALQKTRDFMPDVVISDVVMPVMDGFEFCRALKNDLAISHIPVILLTSLGDESSLTGYKMGADLYLSKPFGLDLLLTIMANMFRTRNEQKKRYAQPETKMIMTEIAFSNADEHFMSKLIRLIEERLDDSELHIDALAEEMAMSRSSFYNKVKVITGISANAFIVDYKIKRAIRLLQNPDLPIQEIAMQLGFTDQRYFSTVFKQTTGKTPTKYRTENLENSAITI